MKIILKKYNLPLKHTFTISRESHDIQPTLIVILQDGDFSGFGEATSNPYYNITVDSMKLNLEKITPFIETIIDETPEVFWQKANRLV